MKIAELSVRRPVATLMLLVSLVVLGLVSIPRLPLGAWPLVERPIVRVEVPFPGAHPLEVLREVIEPLEAEVATLPGVRELDAEAESGSGWVQVEFDWDEDIDVKKIEVREAVERVRPRLPETIGWMRIEGRMLEWNADAILHGRISAERDLSQSYELLDRKIRRPIERIAGVARVDLDGVEPRQLRVELDLDALRRHGVRPERVRSLLEAENLDLDVGVVRDGVQRFDVRHVGRFRDVDEVAALRLGTGVRLRDVARVALEEPRLTYGRHLDGDFAIGIGVYQEPTANTVATVDRVKARIDEIRGDPELEGISLLVWNDQGEQIREALRGLRDAGLIGGVLAVVVLFGFLRRAGTTLVVMVAIPFSLIVTCGVMFLVGMELNILTMLGLMLGVGMLVDNAVVVIENIHRLEGRGLSPFDAARRGVREVFMAVVASTLTTVIVWSWLFFAERSHLTIYMGATAATICLAVACSLLVSVTFIPLAASKMPAQRVSEAGFLLRRLVPAYRALLSWTLARAWHRALVLGLLLLLAASAWIPISRIEKSGQPSQSPRGLRINYEIHDPSTKEVLQGYVERVEAAIFEREDDLGFENVYSWFSEDRGTMTQVYLPPAYQNAEDVARIRSTLQEIMPVIPGVELEVGDRLWWRNRGGGGGERRVVLSLRGEDPEYLESIASDVEERLRGVEGVREVWGPSVRGQREVRIDVDSERARALATTPQAVARAVSLAFRGQQLRRFEAPAGEVEMVLTLPEEAQPGLARLVDLPIASAGGRSVALGSVADVRLARTPVEIEREDRLITEFVSVVFEDSELTTPEARERVEASLTTLVLPQGYSWDWGSWGRQRDDELQTMLFGTLISLMVVMLLMAALFESIAQPLAIVITLPLAFFGAFWSLYLFGFQLEVVAFMGVIILVGIVVNNGIVMVEHVNGLRRAGSSRDEALVEGCGDRLRPVLMTAITTIFGLVPLAASDATVGGDYAIDALAVAMIGGLVTSTLFTLVALPVWIRAVEDLGRLAACLLPHASGRTRLTDAPPLGGGSARATR